MVNKRRWLQGPSFLRQEESAWPKTPNPKGQIPDDDPDVKKAQVCLVEKTHLGTVIDQLLERRSSWYMLKKDLAWILRFKLWLRNKARGYPMQLNKGPLTVKETKTAEIEIVKYVQRQNFVNEVKTLEYSDKQGSGKKTESRQIKRSSTIYRLVPVMTPMGVLVVGGRLKNAPIPDETKHQMILPRRHHVVDLIVRHFHECSGHLGREYVLSQIRQQFWIIHARSAVRRVLGNCFACRRRNALPCEQKMADLPRNRVTPDEPPFTYVGIDYFGTFYVKRGRSQVKRYGCIFTCFAIRAIHIEVAHSLDTSSFINALQRFISRRGQPKEITSDNGSNFVGGMRELREAIEGWNQTKIQQFLHQRGIQWKFNPPAASHMGGVWERQIRTVRKVLRALMKEQVVDDEGLSTLMCLVEAIVNGRPLTTNSDDPRDLEALTPNHLLLLRAGPTLPPGIFSKEDIYSKRRWRQIQYLADIFWRRWVREYLPTLQCRQKWLLPKRNLNIGDIVLVIDDNTPRNMWPMASVKDIYTGKDGCVRAVQVQTRTTTLVRPVDKLCLLEMVQQCDTKTA